MKKINFQLEEQGHLYPRVTNVNYVKSRQKPL